MSERYELAREEAKHLLVYYIKTLWKEAGLKRAWHDGERQQVENIIDAIERMIEEKMCLCPLE
ncbi:MAG: hypothetical protein H5U02_00070 [Clostridia bacterium]|nr:hypothetical protein [Clostridia bacterium]